LIHDYFLRQSPEIQDKMKENNLLKYGVPFVLQVKAIRDKGIQTNIKKYGYYHHMHNAEEAEKCSKKAYKLKEYILPSGKIIKLQGYENYALDELLEIEEISEEKIFNKKPEVPAIWYYDDIGKKHRYYVDFYIPSQNRCIEVKSTWTYKINKNKIAMTQQAVIVSGYNFEVWVYNAKGEKIATY